MVPILDGHSATPTAVILWKAGVKSAIVAYDDQRRFTGCDRGIWPEISLVAAGRRATAFRRPHPRATMNLGTYDDILVLERTVGTSRLVEIMLRAEPGWINDRSWEFWRGRLSFATGAAIPDKAPRRSFHATAP